MTSHSYQLETAADFAGNGGNGGTNIPVANEVHSLAL